MLLPLLLLILEFILLYFLSRLLTQNIYLLIYLLTRSQIVAVTVLTIILFPGTIIHELAHMFTAEVLGVHTGGLSFEPDIPSDLKDKKGAFGITTGHVMIAETDPVRRYTIGTAPMFVGVIVLAALSYFLPDLWNTVSKIVINNIFGIKETYLLIIVSYLIFAVSNSMFSSPSDLKGIWALIIVLGLILLAAFFAGLRIELTGAILTVAQKIVLSLTTSLGIILAINFGVFMILIILQYPLKSIRG
jgi:hypothetical protein